MSIKNETVLRVVVYEGGGAEPLPSAERFGAITALLERGFPVTRSTGQGALAAADRNPVLVLGKFGGRTPETDAPMSVRFQDVDGFGPQQIAEIVDAERSQRNAARPGDWKPWFPVIDYDRCTNCMQCLSFCLFGVYGVDGNGKIQAQNEDNCKTNCPACSRVCPEAAIVFPKYKAGPINGDVVSAEDLQREKMKIDISALLGGDVYSMLRERSERAKSRFSKERDANKALTERQKCLTKLVEGGDIPPEVLMSLPAPDEILRRAEEAKAKAQAALSRNADPSAA